MIAVIFLIMWWTVLLGYVRLWSCKGRYVWYIVAGILGMLAVRNYIITWYPEYSMSEDTIVYVGPDESYGICGKISQKSIVKVYEARQKWSKVGYHTMIGWIPSRCVEMEKPHEG